MITRGPKINVFLAKPFANCNNERAPCETEWMLHQSLQLRHVRKKRGKSTKSLVVAGGGAGGAGGAGCVVVAGW